MAETPEDRAPKQPEGAPSPDPAALHLAMSQGDAAEEARDYLRRQSALTDKQSALADLQIEFARDLDRFELSHLRWRQFADRMGGLLRVSIAMVVVLILAGIGTMVWNAANDRDLVVDAFSVPPTIAQTGMTGEVLAGRVLDRFGTMQAGTYSFTQGAEGYRGTETAVRVEIPETGISIGELNQYLREWLGDETHVTGNLVHTGKGYALTIRYGSRPGTTLEGDDLGKLVTRSAEQIYAAAQPLRYAKYLTNRKRYGEAEAVIRPLTLRGSARERSLAYSTWVNLLSSRGDTAGVMQKLNMALRLDPKNPTAMAWLASYETVLGHTQMAVDHFKACVDLWKGQAVSGMDPGFVAMMPFFLRGRWTQEEGDFLASDAAFAHIAAVLPKRAAVAHHAFALAGAHDIAAARNLLAALPAKEDDGTPNFEWLLVSHKIAQVTGDWSAARALERRTIAARRDAHGKDVRLDPPRQSGLALDMAKTGDIAGAAALIAKSPLDCDFCVLARGRIAAMKRDWKAAAHWFALVSARSQTIPFADYRWGRMLLAKGDLDGAIARFKIANKKSPHFADALEYWGEALIAKNRSDLALAKFEEANKYAPNWGRLHLKWGEALLWSGDKQGARKQFAIAMKLYLTAPEKRALATVTAAARGA